MNNTIAQRLISLREQAGLTEIDLADIIGCSVRTINLVEFGILYSNIIAKAYCEAVGFDFQNFQLITCIS